MPKSFLIIFAACLCVFLPPADVSAQKTSSLKKSKPVAETELSADDLDLTAELDADTDEPVFKSQPKENPAAKKTTEKKTPEKKTTPATKKAVFWSRRRISPPRMRKNPREP